MLYLLQVRPRFVAIPAVTNEGSWRASFLCFPYQLRTRLWERMGPMRLSDRILEVAPLLLAWSYKWPYL